MTDRAPKILIVDDETGILDTLRILLTGEGFDVETAVGGQAGLDAVQTMSPDVVLSDIRMPGATGLEILAAVRQKNATLPVILMTAQASLQTAVKAVNEGAFYYLHKPFSNDELLAICRRAVEIHELTTENAALKKEISRRNGDGTEGPIGNSPSFKSVLDLASTVAPTDSTVLISGESGVGKEVLAKYLHNSSRRADSRFLSINCGALSEGLLESELFGHVQGSFTGAIRDKDGLFTAACGGTLFLDEVGEMSPATQVKLLRALQEREVIPVGATAPISIDVRIIAATNRDLEEEIRKGSFRSDLFYRLNVIQMEVPPLRERRGDIPLLLGFFLRTMAERVGEDPKQVSEEAMELLVDYQWPGNVRELQNALERAAIVSLSASIEIEDLPVRIRETPAPRLVSMDPPANPSMEVVEQAYIQWVLAAEGGNKTRASEVLGIDPSTLYRKLNRYGLAATGAEPENVSNE